MQLYGEQERGFEYGRTIISRLSGLGSSGGAIFYWSASLPPSDFQVLPAAQSGRDTSDAGEPGRADSGAAIQALAGARRKWAASEGSLPPTGRAYPAPSVNVGESREGESTSAQKQAVGKGQGV